MNKKKIIFSLLFAENPVPYTVSIKCIEYTPMFFHHFYTVEQVWLTLKAPITTAADEFINMFLLLFREHKT